MLGLKLNHVSKRGYWRQRIWQQLGHIMACNLFRLIMTSSNETFPRYWPFARETTGHRWIPLTKASDAELWCFFFYLLLSKWLSKQSKRWWFETPPHSLWRHCNVKRLPELLPIGKCICKLRLQNTFWSGPNELNTWYIYTVILTMELPFYPNFILKLILCACRKKKHGWPRGRLQFEQYFKYPITYIICTETQNVTIWNFLHWLPWQPAMKISSKWQHPRFSVHTYLGTSGEMLYGGRERSCVDPWLSSGSRLREHEDSPRGFAEFAHLGDVVEFSSGGFRLENVCSIGLLVEFRLAASWSWWAPFNDGGSLFGEALAG